jgi:hypothetical protein
MIVLLIFLFTASYNMRVLRTSKPRSCNVIYPAMLRCIWVCFCPVVTDGKVASSWIVRPTIIKTLQIRSVRGLGTVGNTNWRSTTSQLQVVGDIIQTVKILCTSLWTRRIGLSFILIICVCLSMETIQCEAILYFFIFLFFFNDVSSCDICFSHSSAAEDEGHLGCGAMSVGVMASHSIWPQTSTPSTAKKEE